MSNQTNPQAEEAIKAFLEEPVYLTLDYLQSVLYLSKEPVATIASQPLYTNPRQIDIRKLIGLSNLMNVKHVACVVLHHGNKEKQEIKTYPLSDITTNINIAYDRQLKHIFANDYSKLIFLLKCLRKPSLLAVVGNTKILCLVKIDGLHLDYFRTKFKDPKTETEEEWIPVFSDTAELDSFCSEREDLEDYVPYYVRLRHVLYRFEKQHVAGIFINPNHESLNGGYERDLSYRLPLELIKQITPQDTGKGKKK